jgi:hypothetical protein
MPSVPASELIKLALLQLNFRNIHCRHIILGGSHDNGYARILEDLTQDPNATNITLLEGVPFERELAQLKSSFACLKFENLFRDTKINVFEAHRSSSIAQHSYTNGHGVPPSPSITANGANGGHQQVLTGYQSPYTGSLARTPSSSTSNSATPVLPTTWATKAMSAPPLASPPPTPQPPTSSIPRNKFGQRIDPLMKVDPSDYKRVQKIKMCNVHFLRRDCPYGDGCTHDHAYKPSKNDIEILRQVARSTPCHYGTECDDVKCIYGHRYVVILTHILRL